MVTACFCGAQAEDGSMAHAPSCKHMIQVDQPRLWSARLVHRAGTHERCKPDSWPCNSNAAINSVASKGAQVLSCRCAQYAIKSEHWLLLTFMPLLSHAL